MAPGALQQTVACVVGVALLVPTLVFVLVFSSQRWTFDEPCDVPDGSGVEALFDYLSFYSCARVLPVPVKVALLLVWLALLISLLASTADMFFVPQLEAMSRRLALPEDVAGVTLLALGNGMPDVMTATSSINNAEDVALSMGEFLGAANFILSLVLGCVLLTSAGPTRVQAAPFWRDSLSYLVVLLFMVAATWNGIITFRESLLFPLSYVAYVVTVAMSNRCRRSRAPLADSARGVDLGAVLETFAREPTMEVTESRTQATRGKDVDTLDMSPSTASTMATFDAPDTDASFVLMESDSEASPEDEDYLEGFGGADNLLECVQLVMELPFTVARHASIPSAQWNQRRRALAAICPVCSTLLILLSFQGWSAFTHRWGAVPVWLCCVSVGLLLAVGVLLGSSAGREPPWHALLLLLAFVCAIAWFNLLANECVAVLETFGLKFGVSSSVLGITVLAWGNSVGDLVADTALVKKGKARMAVAGCFGSPLLSDLLGLGVALTAHTSSSGEVRSALSLQNKVAAGFALASILSTMAAFSFSQFSCPRWFGFALLVQYGIFMCISVLLEMEQRKDQTEPLTE